MPNPVEGLLEVYEDMVEVLPVLVDVSDNQWYGREGEGGMGKW